MPKTLRKNSGKNSRFSFDEYYGAVFGGRWPGLKEALQRPPRPSAFGEGLLCPYYLDRASVFAARALGETGSCRVLDMCAAPGGKTLVLASTLGQGGEIVANERSSQRRKRLKTVLDAHLAPALRSCVAVTGHNAAVWGLHEKNAYDRVLLDAPCSSERHLVLQPRYLAAWSPSRSRSLARQAYAMLLAALDAAKPGGLLLYSTCALLEAENDEVIRRALERRPGAFTPIAPLCAEKAATLSLSLEKTRFGSLILPDTSDGAGPLYFALLRVG